LVDPGDHIASEEQRPVVFHGPVRAPILFYLEELAAIAAQLKDFKFVPALSHAEADEEWDGETGFVMRSSCAICAEEN